MGCSEPLLRYALPGGPSFYLAKKKQKCDLVALPPSPPLLFFVNADRESRNSGSAAGSRCSEHPQVKVDRVKGLGRRN